MITIALRRYCACFISSIASETASRRAVDPPTCIIPTCRAISSLWFVMPAASMAWLLNCTRKNSSAGLALFRSAFTASYARFMRGPMLSLVSNTRPMEAGASSAAKCVIVCCTLSSKSVKCSFSRPDTTRPLPSRTVTGIWTRSECTRMVVELGYASLDAVPVLSCGSPHIAAPTDDSRIHATLRATSLRMQATLLIAPCMLLPYWQSMHAWRGECNSSGEAVAARHRRRDANVVLRW